MPSLWTRRLAVVLFLGLLLGCEPPFHYSPYTIETTSHQLTAINQSRVEDASLPHFAPFRFALTADTHGYYDELDELVNRLNKRDDIAFLLIAGDLTDYGMQQEYQWTVDILQRLAVPYLTVLGNHDSLNNGKQNYQAFFGPFDYSFVYNQVKFVALNSNSWEFDDKAPRLDWLEAELDNDFLYRHQIVLTHLLPQNDRFTAQQAADYRDTVEHHLVSLLAAGHSHAHSYSEEILSNGQTIGYLATGTLKDRAYIAVTVEADSISIERVRF
jgi:predicted phosphodiesterase